MTLLLNRRQAIVTISGVLATPLISQAIEEPLIKQHDESLSDILLRQETRPDHSKRGGYPDQWGLYHCGSAAGILENGMALYLTPQSKFYQSSLLFGRLKLAAEFLIRAQTKDGNIDLLSTNFNSPPDTGFVVHHVARAAKLARMHQKKEMEELMKPFLLRAGSGMAKGGIHTPNHRWVVSAALAQLHDLYPNPKYIKRIDQWLAEGIDIDKEGQYIERSTTVYNAVSNFAFVTLAHKLQRPELLEPVRKNLDAMLYLVHPNHDAVTEISRRQDANTRAGLERYWFPLRYMAIHDKNGQYTSLLQPLEPARIKLSALMEYPEIDRPLPPAKPLPDNFVKDYPLSEITRIRRGDISATIIHRDSSRWFSVRNGNAVINAIRFASAFFGKGQFIPNDFKQKNSVYHFEQKLRGPYYQPLSKPGKNPLTRDKWGAARSNRKQSEICELQYNATIKEIKNGFELSIQAKGTDNVPLAIEINLREGGKLERVQSAPNMNDTYLLEEGSAKYTLGGNSIHFGPGKNEHAYTQIRGALDKLSGPSVYITGFTPFEHTLTISCS